MTTKHLKKSELNKNCIISTTQDIKLEKRKNINFIIHFFVYQIALCEYNVNFCIQFSTKDHSQYIIL